MTLALYLILLLLAAVMVVGVAGWAGRGGRVRRNLVGVFLAVLASYSAGFLVDMLVTTAAGQIPVGNVVMPACTWLVIGADALIATLATRGAPALLAAPFAANALLALAAALTVHAHHAVVAIALTVLTIFVFMAARRRGARTLLESVSTPQPDFQRHPLTPSSLADPSVGASHAETVVFDVGREVQARRAAAIVGAFGDVLATPTGPHKDCMYRPTSDLPYPKEMIRSALEAVLSVASGEVASPYLMEYYANSEAAEAVRGGFAPLDIFFVDIPADRLPTDRLENGLYVKVWRDGGDPEEALATHRWATSAHQKS